MRFLADESCDFRVVRALRAAGHDVIAVIESMPGADDSAVIAISNREHRILLTEDRDFGRLVYASALPSCGVVLLRYPTASRNKLPSTLVEFVAQYGDQIARRFVVLEPGRARIGGTA
jgi:predicted nuclease of predicted toxin-antitoxin system